MLGMPKMNSYAQRGETGNALMLTLPNVTIWFSYTTPIAFEFDGQKRVVHENDWSKTTGQHLGWIDGGDVEKRVSAEVFQQLWDEQYKASQKKK